MRRYKIKNRLRFLISMSLLITIMLISFFTLVVSARGSADLELVSKYVEEGDTLWNLSQEYVSNNMDIRDYIIKVMEVNNLKSANIRPGELIYFPIYE
ncbi:MAG: LysM peptidoglycan-binding domain-containing protein [Caulobacteraceae bacterium]